MRIPIAIMISGALIAAAICVTDRWEVVHIGTGLIVARLDHWTGETQLCYPAQGRQFACQTPAPASPSQVNSEETPPWEAAKRALQVPAASPGGPWEQYQKSPATVATPTRQ